MPLQNLSLSAIIAESQQGENAARRAAPRASQHSHTEQHFSLDIGQKKKAPRVPKTQGQQEVDGIQTELDKAEQEARAADEAAKQKKISAVDQIQQIQNMDYLDSFLKIFNLGGSGGIS